jgi:flagellar biosynthesis component FlhA
MNPNFLSKKSKSRNLFSTHQMQYNAEHFNLSVTSFFVCILCVLPPAAFLFLLFLKCLQLIHIFRSVLKSLDLQFEMTVYDRIIVSFSDHPLA